MAVDRNILPAVREFDSLTLPGIEVSDIAPHVHLYILRDEKSPKLRLEVMYGRTNGRESDPVRAAAVQIAAALAPLRTGLRDEVQVADLIDYEGARLTNTTYSGATGLCCDTMPASLPRMADLMGELLTQPCVSPESLQAKINVAVQKRLDQESRIMPSASEYAHRLSAGLRHPYKFPVTADKYQQVTADMVTDIMVGSVRDNELYIFASGKVDAGTEKVIRDLGLRLAASQGAMKPVPAVVPDSPEKACHVHLDSPDKLQTAISAVIPVPIDRFHPDYSALRLSVMALGGYFGSRLMTNIREEKGLTYSIGAHLECTFEGAGIVIGAQCGAGTGGEALREIVNEINRLAAEPMGDAELKRLRRFAATQQATSLDSPFSIMSQYQMPLHLGAPADYFDRQFLANKDLDAATVTRLIKIYAEPAQMRVVTAGCPV